MSDATETDTGSDTESVAVGEKRRKKPKIRQNFNKLYGYDNYIKEVLFAKAKIRENADYSKVEVCQEALQKAFDAGLIDIKIMRFYLCFVGMILQGIDMLSKPILWSDDFNWKIGQHKNAMNWTKAFAVMIINDGYDNPPKLRGLSKKGKEIWLPPVGDCGVRRCKKVVGKWLNFPYDPHGKHSKSGHTKLSHYELDMDYYNNKRRIGVPHMVYIRNPHDPEGNQRKLDQCVPAMYVIMKSARAAFGKGGGKEDGWDWNEFMASLVSNAGDSVSKANKASCKSEKESKNTPSVYSREGIEEDNKDLVPFPWFWVATGIVPNLDTTNLDQTKYPEWGRGLEPRHYHLLTNQTRIWKKFIEDDCSAFGGLVDGKLNGNENTPYCLFEVPKMIIGGHEYWQDFNLWQGATRPAGWGPINSPPPPPPPPPAADNAEENAAGANDAGGAQEVAPPADDAGEAGGVA
jgi:hypothetical protein